jgi:hypothetical protein
MDVLQKKIPGLPGLPRLPGINDVKDTSQYVAKYRSNLLATNRMMIKDFSFRLALDMDPKPMTYLTDNFIQQCIDRQFYYTGTKWKPYIDEHRKYTNYTATLCKNITTGTYWQPLSTKIKGGFSFELLSKNPGIAFDISYDGNHIQLPAVDLQTDGIPTHTALHNLGGFTDELVETRWDTVNNVYGVKLNNDIWFNDELIIQILNATGTDYYVWLNMARLPAIDDYYDTDLKLS